MPRIYISYRSIDSHRTSVAQLQSHFAETFGADNVSQSSQYDGLSPADLQAQVKQHDVLLVVFGRYGLDMVDEAGNRLLADPYDPIHIEIDAALKAKLTVKTLLFDEAVDDFATHLPNILHPLVSKDLIPVSSKAEMPDILEQLTTEFAKIKPKTDAHKVPMPDLSRLVAQPSRRPSTLPEAPATPQPEPPPQPIDETIPRFSRAIIVLGLLFIIGLLVFVAYLMQAEIVQDADFKLLRSSSVGRASDTVGFSVNDDYVVHISNDEIWHFPPEHLGLSLTQITSPVFDPQQALYGMDDYLAIRDTYRIHILDCEATCSRSAIKSYISNTHEILDMDISATQPIVVAVLKSGELLYWNFETNQKTHLPIMENNWKIDDFAQVKISDALDLIVVVVEGRTQFWQLSQLTLLSDEPLDAYPFIGIEEEHGYVMVLDDDRYFVTWDAFGFLRFISEEPLLRDFIPSSYTHDRIAYSSGSNVLMMLSDNTSIHAWRIDEQPVYLGEYHLIGSSSEIHSIAMSNDGRYVATAGNSETVVWEFSYANR